MCINLQKLKNIEWHTTYMPSKNINFVISKSVEYPVYANVTRIRSSMFDRRRVPCHVYCIFPRKISQGGKKSRPVRVSCLVRWYAFFQSNYFLHKEQGDERTLLSGSLKDKNMRNCHLLALSSLMVLIGIKFSVYFETNRR